MNTRRMNRLEELGRVDAEKAFTKKGARNLRDEKKRIVRELKATGGKVKGVKEDAGDDALAKEIAKLYDYTAEYIGDSKDNDEGEDDEESLRTGYDHDDLYDAQKVYFESRKEFFPLVQNIGDNVSAFNVDDKNVIHEILMKRVTTGEFWRNLTQTGSEIINPFIVDLVPFIATTVADGVYAIGQGVMRDGDFIENAQEKNALERLKA